METLGPTSVRISSIRGDEARGKTAKRLSLTRSSFLVLWSSRSRSCRMILIAFRQFPPHLLSMDDAWILSSSTMNSEMLSCGS